jgi:hypothetical protein
MIGPAGEVLARVARGLAPYLQPSGELHDPVFDEPTQYGTAYYAYVNAALAAMTQDAHRRAEYGNAARRGLEVTLQHLLDPNSRLPTTRYYPAVGSASAANLRDFMWRPVLRTLGLLRSFGDDVGSLTRQVQQVCVPDV